MTKSDGNFGLECEDNSSKPIRLQRVNLPSMIHPLFDELHHDEKLLGIICDLVRYWVLYE